jgi:ATP-dependent Clp endopeptidase proteolytic subunit ClpP
MTIISEWGGYKLNDDLKSVLGKRSRQQVNKTRSKSRPKSKSNDSDDESLDGKDDGLDGLDELMNLIGKKPKGSTGDNLYTMNNNIYFQDEISFETADSLKKELREMEEHLVNVASKYSMDAPAIRLHITSGGGSVIAANSIIDCMSELKVPVHTIVDGFAASAATLISIHGSKRYIKKNATMLIHQVRSGMWGKMAELDDDYKNIKKTHEKIKDMYEEKTNLARKDLVKILKHDLDWDAEECLEKGLVDEII